MTTLQEPDVGVSCYISTLPGFRGILKQRYSDFIVNEVDSDGNVVRLSMLDIPREIMEDGNKAEESDDQSSKTYDVEIDEFRSLAGESDAGNVKDLISKITSASEDSDLPIVLSPSSDKAHRTAVHNFFKEKLKFLVTDTVDGPDNSSKCIRVRYNSDNKKGGNKRKRKQRGDKPFDSRGSEHWPDHLGKFLRFNLYKENKDTQEAIGLIGKMLGIQPRSFGFAGTKDKRAVTTQRATVFKQHANKLAALNQRLIGIKVGDFCYVKEELVLGQLLGNRFTITLRGVIADSNDTIKASADSLGKHGFINYFGLQRFGSGSVPTHLIGATLLKGEWKTARNQISDAREYYKNTNDIDGTLRQLPRHLVSERSILLCLKKCPGNYLQALKSIPRTLRMMYVHSYQSYLWNHAASMRVQKYGHDKVMLGDLVYCKGDDTEKLTVVPKPTTEDDTTDDTFDCSLDEIPVADVPEEKITLVKALTAEDIQSGMYSIDDVVLPMPGGRTIFPTNDIAKVYHDLANKDSVNLTESNHNVKEFSITSITGTYRRVFQKPMDFEWELMTYTDGNRALAETDLDKIRKAKTAITVKEEEPANGIEKNDPVNQSEKEEDYKRLSNENNDADTEKTPSQVEETRNSNIQESQVALKLSFTLPASCYATMAIRELLKTSTSAAFHKTLTQPADDTIAA
ncbi:hypothetical protein ACFE04_027438 [Oxalis oulophora]